MKANNTSVMASYTVSFTVDFCIPETHPSKAKSNAGGGGQVEWVGGRGWRFYSAMFLTREHQGSTQFIKLLQSFFSWLSGFTDQKIQWLLNDF